MKIKLCEFYIDGRDEAENDGNDEGKAFSEMVANIDAVSLVEAVTSKNSKIESNVDPANNVDTVIRIDTEFAIKSTKPIPNSMDILTRPPTHKLMKFQVQPTNNFLRSTFIPTRQ